MTQPNDPWAATSATQAPPAQQGVMTNPLPFDTNNLFGSPSDFGGGGQFTPTPTLEFLSGRTLVYIPRSFNPAAPNRLGGEGATQKLWTVDLYVIDGGKLTFWYKDRGDANATPPIPPRTVEMTHEDCSPQTPYAAMGAYVGQAAFVSRLTAASDARRFLVCTPVRGAQKQQRDSGQTDESVRAEYLAWVTRGKIGPEPKFVWLPSDVSAEAMQRVVQWWGIHGSTIKL